MKQIDDIRRDNMALLRDEFSGVTGLSKKLDRSESQVSQWINGSLHSVTGKPRGMKTITARWIEATVGKPEGWLDQPHDQPETDLLTRYQAADPATRMLIDMALAKPDDPIPPGLSPSVKAMVDMARAALRSELGK